MNGANIPALADTWRSGPIPLQADGEPGTTLATRTMRHAVRIAGRNASDNEMGLGHYQIDTFTSGELKSGDIIGGLIWENERVEISGGDRTASIRETPAWEFAWPATIVKRSGEVVKARPIFDDRLKQDDRFVPLEVVSMSPVGPGRRGIVLDAVKESKQIELFFPADGIMVSHWRGKAPNELSSLVFDINAKGEVDEDRLAPIDTAWRISRPLAAAGSVDPLDKPSQVLAWNITSSPSGEGFGMLVGRTLEISLPKTPPRDPIVTVPPGGGSVGDQYDKISSGRSEGDKYDGVEIEAGGLSLAYAGVERGGPFYVGAGTADKHFHGLNADGEPLGPAHIQAAALFYATEEMDAPMAFEPSAYPPACLFSKTVSVHLKYDAGTEHPYVGPDGEVKTARGLWRWHSWTPFKPSIPGVPIPPEQPLSMVIPDGQSSGNSPGGGSPGNKLFPPRDTADKENQQGAVIVRRIAPHIIEGAMHGLARIANEKNRPQQVAAVESDNELGLPAMSWRPMKTALAGGDLRYVDQNTIQQHEDRETAPIAARMEAFGGGASSDIDGWEYNEQPGAGRYVAGTSASGGVAFLPAELGIEDVAGIEPPSDVVPSKPALSMVRSCLAWSWFVDADAGLPVDGYQMAQEDAGGNLQLDAVDPTGVVTPVRAVHPTGHYQHQSSTGYPTREVNNFGFLTSTSLTEGDHTLVVDTSLAAVPYDVNLPAVADFQNVVFQVSRFLASPGGASRRVRINPQPGEQIDQLAPGVSLDLASAGQSVTLKATGSQWHSF